MNKDFNKSLKPGANDAKDKNMKTIGGTINMNKGGDSNLNTESNNNDPFGSKPVNNLSGLNKNMDDFDVFGITPSPDGKKNTPKIDSKNKKDDDFGSIFSNQAIRNQNHYNSHSSGVIGKETGMGKFSSEYTMSSNNNKMGGSKIGEINK